MRHVFCAIGGANNLNSLLAAVLQDSPCRMLAMSLSRISDTRSRARQIAHVLLSYGIGRHGTCVSMQPVALNQPPRAKNKEPDLMSSMRGFERGSKEFGDPQEGALLSPSFTS